MFNSNKERSLIPNQHLVKNGAGFTLVEMMIATAVFALAFVAISAIFLGVTNSQAKANAKAEILNESQLIFEQVAREIRAKKPFTGPDCNCSGSSFICLNDLANNRTFIRYNASAERLETYNGLVCSDADAGGWAALNASSIFITRFEFRDATPLAGTVTGQPLTTIIMKVDNKETSAKRKAEINLQTTISSRVYGGSLE